MKTRREMCVLILWLMLAPLAAWLGNARADAAHANFSAEAGEGIATQAAQHGSITGEWQGAISRLHIIVKIDAVKGGAGAGAFTGNLTSVDQGNVTLPIDTVSFDQSGVLRLELKRIAASYEGELSQSGAEITGTWQQSGNSIPLVFHRPGAASGLDASCADRIQLPSTAVRDAGAD